MKKVTAAILTVQKKTRMLNEKLTDRTFAKRNGEAGIIAALIMIVIIVAILIVCRDAIAGWVNTLIGYFDESLNSIIL